MYSYIEHYIYAVIIYYRRFLLIAISHRAPPNNEVYSIKQVTSWTIIRD